MKLPWVLVLSMMIPCWVAAEPSERPKLKLSKAEQTLLDLTNKARAKEHLPPLKPNPILFRVARAHAANMARQQKMDHVLNGKNPIQRIEDAGYDRAFAGENIALTYSGVRPSSIFKQWMNSKIHRENILRRQYKEIGIGLAHSDKGDYYYAQEFGSQRPH